MFGESNDDWPRTKTLTMGTHPMTGAVLQVARGGLYGPKIGGLKFSGGVPKRSASDRPKAIKYGNHENKGQEVRV